MRKAMTALLALLVLLAAVPGLAETRTQANPDTGYTAVIDDAARLLDGADYDGVLAEMMKVTAYCNAGLVTYSGSDGTYALKKAENWAQETFGKKTCTVFIIDMATRHLDIWSSEDVYQTVTTSVTYSITDNTYGYAKKGQYAVCARETFAQIFAVLDGQKIAEPMRYISCALIAMAAAILLAYLVISARMEQEVKVSMPEIVTATAGVGAAIIAKNLTRVVHHESSSGGGHGGGGGFGGGGGGFSGGGGGGGGHGF